MDLATLHTAVRNLTRGAPEDEAELPLSERASLRALRRRLRAVGRRMDRLAPPSGSRIWLAPQRTTESKLLKSTP